MGKRGRLMAESGGRGSQMKLRNGHAPPIPHLFTQMTRLVVQPLGFAIRQLLLRQIAQPHRKKCPPPRVVEPLRLRQTRLIMAFGLGQLPQLAHQVAQPMMPISQPRHIPQLFAQGEIVAVDGLGTAVIPFALGQTPQNGKGNGHFALVAHLLGQGQAPLGQCLTFGHGPHIEPHKSETG